MARYCPLWAWSPLATCGLCICLVQTEFLLALVLITLSIFRYGQVQIPSALAYDLSTRACVIQVDGQPVEKVNTWSVMGKAIALRDQGTWIAGTGYWKVYFDKTAQVPKVGARYLISGYVNPISRPLFPGGMDWPSYYTQRGVGGQIYAKKDYWAQLGGSASTWDWLSQGREYFQLALRRALPVGVNRDVAEAMFLGVSSSIDFETMQRYASLGAIHILSVSGLHVGFLYVGLAFIFGFFRRWPWIHFLLIMLFLWAYAGMTGFSGPVLRSAWMFSIVLGARSFRLNHHPVNTLAFSCLVLLVWDPQYFFQAGFQLSYMAVLGLILFQSGLKKMVSSRYWICNQMWEVTCVAIAAQALTWPLVIFYFHQYPNPVYFFLLNPLLILISSITLGVGFVFLALSPLAISWLGDLLELCFTCFHGLLFFVADYFHPVIPLLQLNFFVLLAYYLSIILIGLWWRFRKISLINCLAILWIAISVPRWFWAPVDGMFVTVHQAQAVAIQVSGTHAALYGAMSPAWVQSNVIPMLTQRHVQDTISRKLPQVWSFGAHTFYVVREACKPGMTGITDLIIEPIKSTRDLRWLQFWPQTHWYFVRRPSAYRLGQLRGFRNKGITFLGEVPAVYIKKKAARRQPEID